MRRIMWKACIGFIGELKNTYTILDRNLKGTDTHTHQIYYYCKPILLKTKSAKI
jgi:hypothetical protein